MKTDVILVSNKGDGLEAALAQAEKVAKYKGLTHKSALHLRLLTEEMAGMLGSIAGDIKGKFWIEDEDGVYQLHLQVETSMDAAQRKQLISASSSGVNEASRGIMGKLRAFFEPEDDLPVFYDMSLMQMDGMYGEGAWSMRLYREELTRYMEQKRAGAQEAWDELEKSVVAHVADDVKVSIRGRTVEMTIVKKLA
ncbi:MAG: hypothetical protein IJ048_06140 [Clostridia bacterium]|nr:hypothetical protein [Clostridia bacterium]